MLVFNVLGVSGFGEDGFTPVPEDAEQPLIDLQETYRSLSSKNLLESFHDAQQALDSALNLFSLGYLPLQAAQPGRDIVLGHLPAHAEAWPRSSTIFRKSWKAWTACCPTPISAIFRCSRACPTVGP